MFHVAGNMSDDSKVVGCKRKRMFANSQLTAK